MSNYKLKNINDYNEKEINDFYKYIYKDKQIRINKYKNQNKKKESIIGELELKELLKEKYNIKYDEIMFYTNKNGKPLIKNKPIYFNISHSNNYIITIISNNEIGIDIEKIKNTNINTINQFATKKEKEYILKLNTNIEKRLFEIYTLKEAYIKMKGLKLANILDIEFTIKDNKITCSDKNTKAYFINEQDDYIISVCEYKKKGL